MNTPLIKKTDIVKTQKNKEKDTKTKNRTLEGVLINNHLREPNEPVNFDDVCNSLLISSLPHDEVVVEKNAQDKDEQSFSAKKALMPLLVGVGATFLGTAALSFVLRKSSGTILSTKNFEKLPDLARNMNIKQEPQFAVYRALRDPSNNNIFAAAAVFVFSGLSIAAKNFGDGVKEVWVKKQEADV